MFSPSYINILKGNMQSRIRIFAECSVPHHHEQKGKYEQTTFPLSQVAEMVMIFVTTSELLKFCSISAHKLVWLLDYRNI